MNKGQIVEAISESTGIQKKDVGSFLDAQDKLIGEALKRGEEFTLGRSGKLLPVDRAARTARNPATGETVDVPAKKSAKFKPSKDLISALA